MEETTLRDQVRAAESEIANGRTERALALCQGLQVRFPRAIVVQRLLGEIYLAMNRPDEALSAMQRVLVSDPDDARACCALAIAHQMRGDRATALTWYRRACEIRPEDNMLRQAYRELAMPLGQRPYHMSGAALARLYLRGDLYLHAEHEWQDVLTREPERLDALLGLAEAYWRSGDGVRASNTVRRVLNQAPDCVKGLLMLAASEQAAGNDTASQELLRTAADLDPERRMGRALYAELIGAGNSALASHLFARAGERETGVFPAVATGQYGAFGAAVQSGSLPPSAQEDLAAVNSFANSRSGAVPEDFHSIFAETEFMLWGRDDDAASVPVVEPPVAAPASGPLLGAELPIDDAVERARPAMPRPAFGHADGSMEDTESRAAVGWVQWLQALGARPLDTPRPRVITAPAQSSPLTPPSAGSPSGSLKGIFDSLETPAVRPATPPYQPPFDTASPFAPLAGAEQGRGVSEMPGDIAGAPAWDLPSADAGSGGLGWDAAGDHTAFAPPATEFTHEGDATLIGPLGGSALTSDESGNRSSYAGGGDLVAAGDEAESTFSHPDGPTTLEALQQQFSASGFQPYEPRPGDLASLANQSTLPADDEPAFVVPPAKLLAGSELPAALDVSDLPAQPMPGYEGSRSAPPATDANATLLDQARALRARGELAEALAAYAAELREAPERTDQVIADLRALSEQSNDPAAYRLLGDAYIHAGSYEQALEAYNQAQAHGQGEGA